MVGVVTKRPTVSAFYLIKLGEGTRAQRSFLAHPCPSKSLVSHLKVSIIFKLFKLDTFNVLSIRKATEVFDSEVSESSVNVPG